MTSELKVLHIVGSLRTGSTILGNLFGELDGFFHAGELRNAWKNLLRGRACGCGLPVGECSVWCGMREDPSGSPPDPVDVLRWQRDTLRTRHLRRLLRQDHGRLSGWDPLDSYRRALTQLYRVLATATGARVIVDSSKWPPHAAVAASLPGVEPYFIHLVREPRGVAYSRQGSRSMTLGARQKGATRRLHLARDGWRWVRVNVATEAVCWKAGHGRFLRLRYEDFVTNPRRALEETLNLLGERSLELPILDDRTVRLGVNHTVGGNSNRLRTGEVQIQEDARWVTSLNQKDQMLTALVTLPLLLRYGYRVGGGLARGRPEPWARVVQG